MRILVAGLIPFVGSMLILAATVWLMSTISVQLALIALGGIPVLFLLSHRCQVRMRPRHRSVKNRKVASSGSSRRP